MVKLDRLTLDCKKEQARISELPARFQPEDRWNVDESTLRVCSTGSWYFTEANERQASKQIFYYSLLRLQLGWLSKE